MVVEATTNAKAAMKERLDGEQSVYPRPVELPITLHVVVIVERRPSPIFQDRNSCFSFLKGKEWLTTRRQEGVIDDRQ